MSYRDVQYLILKLRTKYLDLLKSLLHSRVMVIETYGKMFVYFFFVHPLHKMGFDKTKVPMTVSTFKTFRRMYEAKYYARAPLREMSIII